LQRELQQQKEIVANLSLFQNKLKDLQIKFHQALMLLPNTKEIPSLLTNISNLAQQSGLEILLFQPKEEIPKQFYAEIPVEMKIKGKYHDIAMFFDRVSKLPRIVNIVDLKMKAPRKIKSEEEIILDTSFKAVTFKFIEGKKKGAKKKIKKIKK